jgi:hypothetical protein
MRINPPHWKRSRVIQVAVGIVALLGFTFATASVTDVTSVVEKTTGLAPEQSFSDLSASPEPAPASDTPSEAPSDSPGPEAAPTVPSTVPPKGTPPKTTGNFAVRDATNTGPHGTLHDCGGSQNIKDDGAVIQDCEIHGNVGVLADNVTIRNSRIHGQVVLGRGFDNSSSGDVHHPVIQDTEVIGDGSGGSGISGVADFDGVYQRDYMHNWENCATFWTSTRAQVLDNFCTNPQAPSSAHIDGFEVYGVAGGITISGNTILQTVEPAAAPLNITPTPSITGTVTVTNNLMRSANPAYVILGDDSQGNTGITAVIDNNRLWPDGSSGYLSLRNKSGKSHYSGTGNTDWLAGQNVPVQ